MEEKTTQPRESKITKARKKRGTVIRQKVYKPREVTFDYLKYHGIVFSWVRKKYNIKNDDIDILLFLYSEKIFTNTTMKEYAMIYTFGRKKLNWMIEKGWIRKFRDERDGRYLLYELTQLGKRVVNSIYKKLNGEEELTPLPKLNERAEKLKTKDRAYEIMLKKMDRANKIKREAERHPNKPKVEKKKPKRREPSLTALAFRKVD